MGEKPTETKWENLTKEMLAFIEESPTAFHAAANVEQILTEEGFLRLEGQDGGLEPGGRYYTMQNGSAIIAVRVPKKDPQGFRIVASHSDSPCFKLKESPEIRVEGNYTKLNAEKYGGMLLSTWLDRPLSLAGRAFVKEPETGEIVQRLVNFEEDMLIIPNVAIHFNREANDGLKLNPQTDLLPLFSTDQEMTVKGLCARQLGVSEEEIRQIVTEYAAEYEAAGLARGIQLLTLGGACQLVTKEVFSEYIKEALGIRDGGNLSKASLETLAIIAYNQPVTRSYIDQVRGVDSAYSVGVLMERELIEEKGRMDVPGRPRLYGTTEAFLRVFGLSDLSELPPLPLADGGTL